MIGQKAEAMNEEMDREWGPEAVRLWNEWVDRNNPPVRACVRADLWRPGMLVEIMVIAAK